MELRRFERGRRYLLLVGLALALAEVAPATARTTLGPSPPVVPASPLVDPSLLNADPPATLHVLLQAIDVIDSGVDATRAADFGARVVTQINLSSRDPAATGDDFGHGTMIAGIAAGSSSAFPGVAPLSPIVSIRTADANDQSLVSDVV